jgi:hypothetical protein
MKFMQRNLRCIAVLVLYALCILAANPQGDFPLNDDWSYIRSAFAVGSGQGFKVDEWVAPSLVGQALYGGMLAGLFSPSFLVLRLSTLLLSCCTVMLLWAIFLRIGFRRDLACIMLLAWIFDPLQFNLSFTFMTEVPFLFFVALAIYLFVEYLDAGRSSPLVFSAAALGYAFLIRQTALFFSLALICGILINTREGLRKRIQLCAAAAAVTGVSIASFYLLTMMRGGSTAAMSFRRRNIRHGCIAARSPSI